MSAKTYRIDSAGQLPEVADPVELLTLLFDRLLLECEQATAFLASRDFEGKSRSLGLAQEMVAALTQALDHAAAPELCSQMERLYFFAHERLEAADRENQVTYIREAVKVLSTLHEAFMEAAQLATTG
jgi:flagellar biosynthetic protein FliS